MTNPDMDYTVTVHALEDIGAKRYAEILSSAVKSRTDGYDLEPQDSSFYDCVPPLADILMKYVLAHREAIGCTEE